MRHLPGWFGRARAGTVTYTGSRAARTWPIFHIALLEDERKLGVVARRGDQETAERQARELVRENARYHGLHHELTLRAAANHCTVVGVVDASAAERILRALLDEASVLFGARASVTTRCACQLLGCLSSGTDPRPISAMYTDWMLECDASELTEEQRWLLGLLRDDDERERRNQH
jgi:hypothetical protein